MCRKLPMEPSYPFSSQYSAFRRRLLRTIACVSVIGLGLRLIASVAGASSEPATTEDIAPAYAVPVASLLPEDCGRCHTDLYYLIKNEGGKHKIDCRQCHVQFHIYRPGRVSYEEILPRCGTCHDHVHGEDLTQCSECHTEAHAPMSISAGRALEEGCHICHPESDREMKTYVTRHTELYCFSCHHTRHGYVPECMECHQPHSKEMTHADCLKCHPPHKALEVVYPEDIPQESCIVCHRNAYEVLMRSGTKHATLSCTKCHPKKHRAILRCQECHSEPHGAAMLQKFRVCGQCHGIAHSLCQG
jgi:hypothetical protein